MSLLLIIVILLLLFGGGLGGYYGHQQWGPAGGIGIPFLVIVIILTLVLRGV